MTSALRPAGIGPVLPDEIPAVARLAAACLREAWSEAGYAAAALQPGALLRVSREPGGALAGFVLAHLVVDELHVLALVVAPASRRRGVARALLETVLAEGRPRQVHLEVRPSNAAARGFYGSLGFSHAGTRRGYYPDGEDALLLSRGAAAAAPGTAARR